MFGEIDMKFLHRVFGALFSIYYLNVLVVVLGVFLNYNFYLLPALTGTILLIGYFAFMAIHSYNHNQNRVYPILFLAMIGIILLFPRFAYLNFFFLITYAYLYSTRNPFSIPMSFIAIGHFIAGLGIIAPIGYALIIYGWVTYAIKKPATM